MKARTSHNMTRIDPMTYARSILAGEQLEPTTAAPARRDPAAPVGLRKVSFGGIAKKETKTEYPVYPDNEGSARALADWILEHEAVAKQLTTAKHELSGLVAPFYFSVNAGKVDVPSSVSVKSTEGEVLVTFSDSYKTVTDDTALNAVIPGRVGEYFRQKFALEIDGDKIPVDKQEKLALEVQELFSRFGCSDALSVKDKLVPVENFKARRHLDFPPDINMKINEACAIICRVVTKGRGNRA